MVDGGGDEATTSEEAPFKCGSDGMMLGVLLLCSVLREYSNDQSRLRRSVSW